MKIKGKSRERGFVLITSAVGVVAAVGMLGVSVDIGRMCIVKSEAQAYVDAAAIAAALELDGTTQGITDAADAVASSANRANFGHHTFAGTQVDFAMASTGPWVTNPTPPAGHMFVRVRASAPVQLLFLPIVVGRTSTTIPARAVAGQVQKTTFKEGLFPFSPFAHDTVGPHFGLTPGSLYTLRWPSNPSLSKGNVCLGDRKQSILDLSDAGGGSERGYIESTSASVIRQTIINDYQSVNRTVGEVVDMTGGAKQSQLNSLFTRINQDTDPSATQYSSYHGNGRRIIAVPINDGGTPPGSNNRIVGVGAFFLLSTGQYNNGGNQPWCAEYIGPWVQGSNKVGAGPGGAWAVRLVD